MLLLSLFGKVAPHLFSAKDDAKICQQRGGRKK